MSLPLDVQIARLRVLTQMALGELPLTVVNVTRDEDLFLIELEHVTDGPCRLALSTCAMRMHDASILHVLNEHIEYLLDVLWERVDSF